MSTSSNMSSETQPKSRASIIQHLELIACDQIQAVNNRNYDLLSRLCGPTWRGTIRIRHSNCQQVGIEQVVQYLRVIFLKHPSYQIKIVDVKAELDEYSGRAQVFLSNEITGFPVGVVKESVGICTFRCEKEEWLAVGYESLPGPGKLPSYMDWKND